MNLSPEQLNEYFVAEYPFDCLEFDTKYKPFQYLEFARQDLSEGIEARNLINSLSNAKRALHLQVDTIAYGYGYKKLKRSSKFPSKIEFLGEIGIATPFIISKINALRNKVEHEFIVPELEQVKDYCDIVELFLRATEAPINTFPDNVEFKSYESCGSTKEGDPPSPLPGLLIIDLEKFEGNISIRGSGFDDGSGDSEQSVSAENTEYPIWIGQILKHVCKRA